MKKYIIMAVLLAVVLYGCTQTETKIVQQAQDTNTPSTESSQVRVEIKGFSFNPPTLTIKKGTTVTWTQRDSTRHTVTSDDGVFESGLLSKDESWSYTFNEAGTFGYHCSPHPSMTAKIIVE